ncbi:MAG: nucleotidyltransferase domain-containing protein [Nitrospirota bacterium]
MMEKIVGINKMDMAINIIRDEFADCGIGVKSILLFGSRAKGTAQHDSDWDFLVVVDRELERNDRLSIVRRIRRRLAIDFISVDIVVKSEESYFSQCTNVGYITYYAAKEGVLV